MRRPQPWSVDDKISISVHIAMIDNDNSKMVSMV